MTFIQSISHPELMVAEDGTITKDGKLININKGHSLAIRGPSVAYWYEGKIKQLSVLRLVYEAHIKKAKIMPNDYVDVIDGDEDNVHVNNLVHGSRYRKGSKNVKRKKEPETYDCWLNGSTEIFC